MIQYYRRTCVEVLNKITKKYKNSFPETIKLLRAALDEALAANTKAKLTPLLNTLNKTWDKFEESRD